MTEKDVKRCKRLPFAKHLDNGLEGFVLKGRGDITKSELIEILGAAKLGKKHEEEPLKQLKATFGQVFEVRKRETFEDQAERIAGYMTEMGLGEIEP